MVKLEYIEICLSSSLSKALPFCFIGLINDIMSKGRRMTYEELCNAVLPVWLLVLVLDIFCILVGCLLCI